MRSRIFEAGAFAVLACAMTAPRQACAQLQDRFVLTPYAGVYIPTTDIVRMNAAAGGASARLDARQKSALALGATGSYWVTDRVGLEVGGAYAYSDFRAKGALDEPGGGLAGSVTEDSYVLLGSARLLMQLLPPESPFNVRFGVGPAVIHRGGNAYDLDEGGEITGRTDAGAAVSLCTRLPVTRALAVRLRAESFLYQARLGFRDGNETFKFDSRFQNDFVLSAGFQVALR